MSVPESLPVRPEFDGRDALGVMFLCAIMALGVWATWWNPRSDQQRLNSLETRVQAIEERAGSCEVVPTP